jgi:hypothetical protein
MDNKPGLEADFTTRIPSSLRTEILNLSRYSFCLLGDAGILSGYSDYLLSQLGVKKASISDLASLFSS